MHFETSTPVVVLCLPVVEDQLFERYHLFSMDCSAQKPSLNQQWRPASCATNSVERTVQEWAFLAEFQAANTAPTRAVPHWVPSAWPAPVSTHRP
jgi:hypothetical protein